MYHNQATENKTKENKTKQRNMNKKNISLIVILGIIALVVIWVISAYNGLVTKSEGCAPQWSKVESQYQRRADLIPNLVNTVKGYAKHENSTLLEVVAARNQATGAKVDANKLDSKSIQNYQKSQDNLSSALS